MTKASEYTEFFTNLSQVVMLCSLALGAAGFLANSI